jgi:LacI family transcriptional regulator
MGKKRRIALYLNLAEYRERQFFAGIERFASQQGPWEYDLPTGALGHAVTDLRRWSGDGVLGFLRAKEIWQQLQDSKLPAVNVSNVDPGPGIPAVRRDFAAIGELAAEYFLHRGFEHHGFYSRTAPDMEMRRTLERAFIGRLQREGHACSVLYQKAAPRPVALSGQDAWSVSSDKSGSAAEDRELLDWLKSLPRPVGILAMDDLYAARLLVACRDLGLSVPEEVAVLGKGNDELVCRLTRPSLSSIIEDNPEVGYQAAALLHRLMDGAKPPSAPVQVAPGAIVDRQSTNVTVTGDTHVRKALRYIAEHACDPITVADVVRQLPIHRTRFEFLFRRALHRPPYTEITRVRMDRAKELLAATSRSVAEIAAQCGFANYSSFSVAFKRQTSLSPRAYRKQYRSVGTGVEHRSA